MNRILKQIEEIYNRFGNLDEKTCFLLGLAEGVQENFESDRSRYNSSDALGMFESSDFLKRNDFKKQFIVFEGGEGCGKTTVLKAISAWFDEKNIDYILTREPGGVPSAEAIRDIILDDDSKNMAPLTECILYACARREHLVFKVIPALEEGKIVLCDRFVGSSYAYQGIGRSVGIDVVHAVNNFVIEGCMPDLTLLLDLDPEIGLKRIADNSQREVNRFDLESLEFHRRIREGYHNLLRMFPQSVFKVDASLSGKEVFDACRDIISRALSI